MSIFEYIQMYSIVNLISRFSWLEWLHWKIKFKRASFFHVRKSPNMHFTFSFPPHFCKRAECSFSAPRQHVNQGEFNKALVRGKLTAEKITRRLARNRTTNEVTRAGVQYAGWGPGKEQQKKERSRWKPVKTAEDNEAQVRKTGREKEAERRSRAETPLKAE